MADHVEATSAAGNHLETPINLPTMNFEEIEDFTVWINKFCAGRLSLSDTGMDGSQPQPGPVGWAVSKKNTHKNKQAQFICVAGRKPPSATKDPKTDRKRQASPLYCGCPFMINGKQCRIGDRDYLNFAISGEHNHDVLPPCKLPSLRTPHHSELSRELTARITGRTFSLADIKNMILEETKCHLNSKDIDNLRRSLKKKEVSGGSFSLNSE